jgi:hypothetical protein
MKPRCEEIVRAEAGLLGCGEGGGGMPWRRGRARGRRGLTLMELLIGLSITAFTCAILATLIDATAMGTASQNDGRRALVRLQAIKAELADELGNARCVLAAGNNYLVYWTGDAAGSPTPTNMAVNFSELRMLEVDAGGNLNVYCCRWPAEMTDSAKVTADTEYAAGTSWYATVTALKGTSYYSTNTLASGAANLRVTLDNALPTAARYIHVQVDINDGAVSRQMVAGTALTNPMAPW